jgi:hypothetical protein
MPARTPSPATSEEELPQTDADTEKNSAHRSKRVASVYDAVAGRVGFNGFLSQSQLETGVTTLTPEEVLLRRVDAPAEVSREYYNANERLQQTQPLPDTEISKAVHAYAADFYSANARGMVNHNYRSLDETALLAFAILLEEASAEALGENGDMVLVEPEGLEDGHPETAVTKFHVRGKVKSPPTPEPVSSEEVSSSDEQMSDDDRKTKKRRYRYGK